MPQPSSSPDLPPAASLSPDTLPAPRQELEANWESSVQDIWVRIRTTKTPTKADWEALIKAERLNRMQWLEAESEGKTRRGGKKALADMMASAVGADGELAKPKATRTRKPRKKAAEDTMAAMAAMPETPNAI